MPSSVAAELRQKATAMRRQAEEVHDVRLSADLIYIASRFEAIAVELNEADTRRESSAT